MRHRLAAVIALALGPFARIADGQTTPALICGAHETEIKVDSLTDSVRHCMRHFEAEVMRAQFEHSYVTSTSITGSQPRLPSWAREIALLLSGYWGQDYYNTYFDQSRSMVRIGLSAGAINGSFGR
jgi:hypothetical protein